MSSIGEIDALALQAVGSFVQQHVQVMDPFPIEINGLQTDGKTLTAGGTNRPQDVDP